jgi:D-arabinose 1-dehydrogenase-like Zn-dependent alcohol dehydrogenase
MQLVDNGCIKPIIYDAEYRGLEAISEALEDAKEHRAWGRAVLRINEKAEEEAVCNKMASKL